MTKQSTPTCGSLYHTLVLALFSPDTPHALIQSVASAQQPFAAFALGTMQGQAEKVYSGACPAFMIRPASDWWIWSCDAMARICHHYSLSVYVDPSQRELWGYREARALTALQYLGDATRCAVNSPRWHRLRARLCGIQHVDDRYHERQTWGQRCEP